MKKMKINPLLVALVALPIGALVLAMRRNETQTTTQARMTPRGTTTATFVR